MDMQDHIIVANDNMERVSDNELLSVIGGISLTGSLIHYCTLAFNAIADLGRSFGTAIRRITSNSICKIK